MSSTSGGKELARLYDINGDLCLITTSQIVWQYRDGSVETLPIRAVSKIEPSVLKESMFKKRYQVHLYSMEYDAHSYNVFDDEASMKRMVSVLREALMHS